METCNAFKRFQIDRSWKNEHFLLKLARQFATNRRDVTRLQKAAEKIIPITDKK